MKKSLMLLIAAGLVAVMTGCGGGGGSSASSKAAKTVDDTTTTTEQSFEVAPAESATNVTYKSTATGNFPPAPPVSSLADAQDEANANL